MITLCSKRRAVDVRFISSFWYVRVRRWHSRHFNSSFPTSHGAQGYQKSKSNATYKLFIEADELKSFKSRWKRLKSVSTQGLKYSSVPRFPAIWTGAFLRLVDFKCNAVALHNSLNHSFYSRGIQEFSEMQVHVELLTTRKLPHFLNNRRVILPCPPRPTKHNSRFAMPATRRKVFIMLQLVHWHVWLFASSQILHSNSSLVPLFWCNENESLSTGSLRLLQTDKHTFTCSE